MGLKRKLLLSTVLMSTLPLGVPLASAAQPSTGDDKTILAQGDGINWDKVIRVFPSERECRTGQAKWNSGYTNAFERMFDFSGKPGINWARCVKTDTGSWALEDVS